jgi:uncharacterized protein
MHVFLSVKVIPNAPRNQVVGWEDGRLRIRICGVPEKGRANQILVDYLAEELGIAKSRIVIHSGEKSRLKRVRIEGLTQEDLLKKWNS